MIRPYLAVVCACLLAGQSWAETEMRPETTQAPNLIDNIEFAASGPIIDYVATRDTAEFKRDITRTGMMVHYASPYEFIAVGASRNQFRQGHWSADVNSLLVAGRNVNPRTAAGVTGRLAVTTNTDKIAWHGEGTWNIRLTESTGIELIGSRDAVETVGALKEGIISNFMAVSVDHALTDRLTVIGMPTYQRFTDGNSRSGLRGWLIYSLVPDWGLGVEIKAQGYDGMGDSHGLYFSPDNYERIEAGLRLRRAIGNWRVIASADAGQERINRDIKKPVRTFALSMQQSFSNNVTVGIQFSYFQGSNSGTDINSSDEYAWRMGRAYMTIPF